MSFVKTDLATQVNPGLIVPSDFKGDILSVFYQTTPQALQAILPPGLKLRGKPYVEVGLNDFQVTNVDVPYKEAAFLIDVTEERTQMPGRFVVAMTLSSDTATFLGRESKGFPKKTGSVGGKFDGTHFDAYCARHDVCYVTYSADCSKPPNDPTLLTEAIAQAGVPGRPEHPSTIAVFNYLWPVGLRTRMKPILQPMWLTPTPIEKPQLAHGAVTLTMSKHDPWASLPVVKILGATVTKAHIVLDAAEDEFITEVDPKAFLPYSFAAWDEPHN